MSQAMSLTLKVWRQSNPEDKGGMETYQVEDISPDMSFLEMLDVLNYDLEKKGEDPIAFDHDCREGVCGCCSMFIDGQPHGPQKGTTACQLHMRSFEDGDTIVIEPWRARAFPVIKDLIVDRTAFDRIIQAGGYISVRTGSAPDGNAIPIEKDQAEKSFEAATCIGCGACVAACKNASAMLFVAAKVAHFDHLPQGQVETRQRVTNMIDAMDREGFGNCTNTQACSVECPKEISQEYIARMNRKWLGSNIFSETGV